MRFSAPLLTVVGTMAGAAAAVAAYQATSAVESPVTRSVADSTSNPAPAGTSWLPCEHGWKVKGTTCVRVKHRVVVVHDLPAPAAAPAAVAGVTQPAVATTHHSGGTAKAEHADGGEDSNAEDTADEPTDDSAEAPDTEDVGGDD